MKRNLQSQCDADCRAEVLAESHAELSGVSLTYRLEWNRETGFWLSVETSDDAARAWVSKDVGYAVRCYEWIKGGSVTPCTLEELLEDFDGESA